jgi:hypothetical protein
MPRTLEAHRASKGWVVITDELRYDVEGAHLDRDCILGAVTIKHGERILHRNRVNLTSARARGLVVKALHVAGFETDEAPLVALDEACRTSANVPKGKQAVADVADVAHPRGGRPTEKNGAQVLDQVYEFTGRFVAYPSEHAHVAHALWIAHTHLMDAWESTPRLAFLSPEPASGKTRGLEATELLVPNPVEAVNVTAAYLFRKVDDDAGRPTILYDEIDTVFGPKAKENEEIRGLLNAGHRRGAVAGRCVVVGKVVKTEEIPAYCAVALAGLGGLPDTILTRSVVLRMRRRAPGEYVEPFRRRVHVAAGHAIRTTLAGWATTVEAKLGKPWPTMPEGIEDRDADLWEPLLAVADAAGGHWCELARVAAVALVADSKASTPSLNVRLLADLRVVFRDDDALPTGTILERLCKLDEAPWGELVGGKPLNPRGLAQRLRQYGVASGNVRVGAQVLKGYERADLADAWNRYLREPHPESATSATAATSPNGKVHTEGIEDAAEEVAAGRWGDDL